MAERHWPKRVNDKSMSESSLLPSLPVLGSEAAGPVAFPRRLPAWLRRQVPTGNANHYTKRLLDELNLENRPDMGAVDKDESNY